MGKNYRELKKIIESKSNEIDYLKRENIKKTFEVAKFEIENKKLRDLLRTRDGKIASFESEIAKLKTELKLSSLSKVFKIPFVRETNHALFCEEHEGVIDIGKMYSNEFKRVIEDSNEKEIGEAPTNFSSPFDEVAFINEQISQNPSAIESIFAKASNRMKNIKKFGTEYCPSEVGFAYGGFIYDDSKTPKSSGKFSVSLSDIFELVSCGHDAYPEEWTLVSSTKELDLADDIPQSIISLLDVYLGCDDERVLRAFRAIALLLRVETKKDCASVSDVV